MSGPDIRKFTDLIGDPNTVLDVVDDVDWFLVYDPNEPLESRRVKVAQKSAIVSPINHAYSQVLDYESTNSTNWTNLATTGPSITINCPSGIALIWFSAEVISGGRGVDMSMGVGVDGGDPSGGGYHSHRAGLQEGDFTVGQNMRNTIGGPVYFAGLDPGLHTFLTRYRVDETSVANNFGLRKIMGLGL